MARSTLLLLRAASCAALESLEARRLLASSVVNGVLTVGGTTLPDTIYVHWNYLANSYWVELNSNNDGNFAPGSFTSVSITGGNGSDFIQSDAGAVPFLVNGGDGNDTIIGGTGSDTLNGDAGNDNLDGFDGSDTVSGGTDADILRGGGDASSDYLGGAGGNDTLYADAGDDTLAGDTGNDTADYSAVVSDDMTISLDNEKNDGGPNWGSDNVYSNVETVIGGGGDDTLIGSSGSNSFVGNGGADNISCGDGIDWANGVDGNDTIHGDGGNDYLEGGSNVDRIYGDAGNDTLAGNGSNDYLYAFDGEADTVVGHGGNDTAWFDVDQDVISSDVETRNPPP